MGYWFEPFEGDRNDLIQKAMFAMEKASGKLHEEIANKQVLPLSYKKELEEHLGLVDMVRCHLLYGWKLDKSKLPAVYEWLMDEIHDTMEKLKELEEE
jgi:hypothetical protein